MPHGLSFLIHLVLTVIREDALEAGMVAYFFTAGKGSTLRQELMNLNWSSFVLGIAIIGLEAGFIFEKREGFF